MPRDRVRISASASWDCWNASSSSASGLRRVVAEPPLGRGDVHAQPDQPLLRPVVQVALQPAQGLRLGDPGGVPASFDAGHLLLQLGAAAQHGLGEAGLEERHAADHEGQGEQRDQADRGLQRDVGEPAVAEADQLGQRRVVAVPRQVALQNQYVSPFAAAAHQARVTAKTNVPVTNEITPQTTSSHDCGSLSGVKDRRRKPEPAGGHWYAGVATSRPSQVRSRNRSSRATRATPSRPARPSRTPPTITAVPRPTLTSVTMDERREAERERGQGVRRLARVRRRSVKSTLTGWSLEVGVRISVMSTSLVRGGPAAILPARQPVSGWPDTTGPMAESGDGSGLASNRPQGDTHEPRHVLPRVWSPSWRCLSSSAPRWPPAVARPR